MQDILSGLRPAVVAMIASAGVSILLLAFFANGTLPRALSDVNWISIAIFGVGLFALRKWKLNPLWILGGAGLAGLVLYSI